ncbi:MAG TPA: type 1 glutamine amidotransferase domain-containing protein [Jatrophihabitans sp.]|jgi:protease I
MSSALTDRRIAFLVANSGVEQVELTSPWRAVARSGGSPVLIAPELDSIQTVNHDTENGEQFVPDLTVAEADPSAFDGLVLPGGVANPDKLRTVSAAVDFVRDFTAQGKPVAAICHGPWMLVEAGVAKGKRLTSWPSLQTDIRNAGGQWQDEAVVICDANGYRLVTSRKPDDLSVFDEAMVSSFTLAAAS